MLYHHVDHHGEFIWQFRDNCCGYVVSVHSLYFQGQQGSTLDRSFGDNLPEGEHYLGLANVS